MKTQHFGLLKLLDRLDRRYTQKPEAMEVTRMLTNT
jgi:hypothetical protein